MIKLILIFLLPIFLLAESNFSGQRLEKSCLEFIRSSIGAECKIELLTNISDKNFQEDNLSASLSFQGSRIGLTKVRFLFKNDFEIVHQIDIPVRVSVYQLMPVVNKKLRAGDKISGKDIEFKKVLSQKTKENLELINGRVLRRSLDIGDVVTEDILKALTIIEKGESVKINVYSGRIKISSMGKALNDASLGDIVRVKRLGGKGIIDAIAVGEGLVRITN